MKKKPYIFECALCGTIFGSDEYKAIDKSNTVISVDCPVCKSDVFSNINELSEYNIQYWLGRNNHQPIYTVENPIPPNCGPGYKS